MAKNKTQRNKVDVDDACQLLKRAKYLLSKIKKEQNLLDAYSGEGWKGHSREKIRPEKELERARKQILESKLSIREVISQLDSLNEVGNNSKGFECKVEILEAINAYLGTQLSLDTTWQDVFKEEAAVISEGDNAMHNIEEEWPSDDSEDEDYDPERKEDSNNNSINTDQDDSNSVWSFNGSIDSDDSGEIATGGRPRKVIDYKKFYEEMFGKDASLCDEISEDDEDWGPGKRMERKKDSGACNTLMTSNNKNNDTKREGSSSSDMQVKTPCFRIPQDAVEKLRKVFAENELPPKSLKEKLSKELELDVKKVNNWFKNSRSMALKTRMKDEVLKSNVSKNGKSVTGKENMKSFISPLKKNRPQKRPPLRDISNKDSMEVSDGVSLKKLLKEKKKRVASTFEGDSQNAKVN